MIKTYKDLQELEIELKAYIERFNKAKGKYIRKDLNKHIRALKRQINTIRHYELGVRTYES